MTKMTSFFTTISGLFLPVLLLNLDKGESEFQKYINHKFLLTCKKRTKTNKGPFISYVIKTAFLIVCKIPLLARALGLKARPSARATIGYLVYNLFNPPPPL